MIKTTQKEKKEMKRRNKKRKSKRLRSNSIYFIVSYRVLINFFQVIRATDVPEGCRMGFGKSISGGVDIDGNFYPGRTCINFLQRMH